MTDKSLEDFRARAARWLAENAPALGSSGDFTTPGRRSPAEYLQVCRAWQRKLFESGWAGISWPISVGGQGLTIKEQVAFDELQMQWGVSSMPLQQGLQMAGPIITSYGTRKQLDQLVRPTLRGDLVWCQLWSEPGAGSDLAGVESYAHPIDGGWVLNGQKVWTTAAHIADRGLLLARTDREAPKHAGLSLFLLDMRSPGVTVRPLRQMNGASEFSEVFFDDVFIPSIDLLGDQGGGWRMIVAAMVNERVGMSPATFNRNQTRFDGLAQLMREAQGAGVLVDRGRLAHIYSLERILSLLHARLRVAAMDGNSSPSLPSISKLAYTDYLKAIGELALEIQGAAGTLAGDDAPVNGIWQDHFLWAPGLRFGGGTDEIQRNILSERVLGLPREPSRSSLGAST